MPYQGVIGWYLGLPEVLGKDGMVKFYTALSANIGGLMTCGDSDRVVSGEFAFFGLDCGEQEVRLRQRKGEPIADFYPRKGPRSTRSHPASRSRPHIPTPPGCSSPTC